MRNIGLQRLLAIILLLGFIRMALPANAMPQAKLPDAGHLQLRAADSQNDNGLGWLGAIKKVFSEAEDASEEGTEKDAGESQSLDSLTAVFAYDLIYTALKFLHVQHFQAHFKHWHACNRLSVLSMQASLYLYLFYALKLDSETMEARAPALS